VEAVFPPEKIQQISGRNTASTSGYSRCFPAGSGAFSASFRQDPVGSSGRNLRHGDFLQLSRNNINAGYMSELKHR